jgi:hypothetical protein
LLFLASLQPIVISDYGEKASKKPCGLPVKHRKSGVLRGVRMEPLKTYRQVFIWFGFHPYLGYQEKV